MTLPFRLVSADSHIAEPPDLWATRIDRRYRERAPRFVSNEQGDGYVVPDDPNLGGSVGLMATKAKYADPDARFGLEGRWSDVPEGAYDPAVRVAELDREGMEAEILYTSTALTFFALEDLEFRRACFRAFNDWLAEHCAAAPKQLFGVAMIATDDVDLGVAELERCVGMGLRGAMISIGQRSGESYGDPKFEKFWSAAEALEVPISLHVAATETTWMNTGSRFVDFACVFTPTMYTVLSMIFSGLFDRHRALKVLSVENDASWPLAVLERMEDRWRLDQVWANERGPGAAITSGRTPSEIFHDHVGCTFMRDRTAIVNRDIIGRENLMWGADFPHFDGAWPDCAAELERQLDGVPLEDRIAIGRNNAIKFYGLPLELASVPSELGMATVGGQG
ncbi:MAG: amidohydrolase family protein [Acidimicrobiales bacterium]